MSTSFDSIQDMFLLVVKDYKLDKLYLISQANHTNDFKNYLDGFLIISIPEFDNCIKNLENINLTDRYFYDNLSLKEQLIISKWMVMKWFDKEIQDVTQFNMHLTDTDFKHYAEANNLKSKMDYSVHMREKINQDMVNYSIKNIPWDDWAAGNFH